MYCRIGLQNCFFSLLFFQCMSFSIFIDLDIRYYYYYFAFTNLIENLAVHIKKTSEVCFNTLDPKVFLKFLDLESLYLHSQKLLRSLSRFYICELYLLLVTGLEVKTEKFKNY